jgi:DNA repair exonuclease SbcCD ATPase subunit
LREGESDGGRDAERARTEIRQEMEALRDRIEALRTKQQPLIDRQRDLGRRQAALGQQQRQASTIASEALEKLARDAVKSGKADRTGN